MSVALCRIEGGSRGRRHLGPSPSGDVMMMMGIEILWGGEEEKKNRGCPEKTDDEESKLRLHWRNQKTKQKTKEKKYKQVDLFEGPDNDGRPGRKGWRSLTDRRREGLQAIGALRGARTAFPFELLAQKVRHNAMKMRSSKRPSPASTRPPFIII
jgi:hypothetical protein